MRMMVKTLVLALALCLSLVSFAFAGDTQIKDGGYTGPGGRPSASYWQVTDVAGAQNMADDTRVVLEGTIIRALGGENYLFADASGEIVVEIDHKEWGDRRLTEKDTVKIFGEIDQEAQKIEIEVAMIVIL